MNLTVGELVLTSYKGSLVAQLVKKPPAIQETQVQSLGWEDPLNKGMETTKYSCLENDMDREVYQPTIHGLTMSQIWLSEYDMILLKNTTWKLEDQCH